MYLVQIQHYLINRLTEQKHHLRLITRLNEQIHYLPY